MGIAFDEELLYVAAMLHDIGLVGAFDNATVSFDEAGGNVAWMFAAGAGWPVERRVRLSEVIVRHMWESVDPALDAEGHLLEVGTAIDISGRDPGLWAPELRAEVLAAHPRLDLVAEFTACFADQARRKPESSAAGGGAQRDREPDRGQRPRSAGPIRVVPSRRPARYPAPVRSAIRNVNLEPRHRRPGDRPRAAGHRLRLAASTSSRRSPRPRRSRRRRRRSIQIAMRRWRPGRRSRP